MSDDLQILIEKNASDPQALFGVFDPSRIPQLDFRSFENIKTIHAAVSPDCSYRLVRDALDAAQNTIDLYIYNVSAGHLLDLLRQARDKGVAIRIMFDVMDTRGDERNKLQQLQVELKEAPSSGKRQVFTVCHQKFVVVDNKIVVLGSANWASTSIPEVTIPGKFKKGNREWLIKIENQDIAKWFAVLFQADWDIPEVEVPAGEAIEIPVVPELEARAAAVAIPAEVFDISPILIEGAKITPITSPDNYFKLIRELIRNAQTSIDIEQQYIKVGGQKTQELLQELKARKNDVEIRILISPAFREGWVKSVETLEAASLLECLKAMNLNSFTHLHNKGILVDSKFAVVTSTNMSENSIVKAREAGVLIESAEIGGYFKRVIDIDWNSGINPADVQHHVGLVEDELSKVEEPTLEIHPADLRII